MRILTYHITEAENGRTVKSVARTEMQVSSSQFSSLKFAGMIFVDGKSVHARERLQTGQVLEIRLEDEGQKITPYDIPFEIPYEDEDLLIVNKPAPLPTMPSIHQEGPALENALYARLGCPENFVFRPINRLDKGTSGLMAVAKNAHAQQLMQKMLHTDSFIREYLAVCCGAPEEKAGVIDLPIGKLGPGVKREIHPDGKPAVTHYRVLQAGKEHSLIRLRLETGRTHQIRVHMQAMGCPVAGDYIYGETHPLLPGRFALHACYISFFHPIRKENISCETPLPPAFQALLD